VGADGLIASSPGYFDATGIAAKWSKESNWRESKCELRYCFAWSRP
jgi:hypothetical protein